MRWFELNNAEGYASLDGVTLAVRQAGTNDWRLRLSGTAEDLKGSYTVKADAHAAARRICQGIDPSTLV